MAVCGNASAATLSREQIVDLFSEAKDLFRKGNDAVAAHNPTAAKELYQRAALRFERIADQGGVRNGKLFYDIGNTYLRLGDLGRAILYYRRAQELAPNDPNLRQNLDQARRQRADKIDVKPQTQVLKTFFFWHYDLAISARLYLFAAFFGLIWTLALLRRFVRRPGLGWGIAVSAIVAALLFGSLLAEEVQRQSHAGGVILASEVVARKGDGETYQPSFEEPLHAGTEFDVVEDRRDWLFIELSDGRRCWVPAQAVGLVE
jgi:tetratricopeptide (TPR) repeat protein